MNNYDLAREEAAHMQTIAERDAAETALSEAYAMVVGEPPKWSNLFGYTQALARLDEALTALRSRPAPASEDVDALKGRAREATEQRFLTRLATEDQRNGYEVGFYEGLLATLTDREAIRREGYNAGVEAAAKVDWDAVTFPGHHTESPGSWMVRCKNASIRALALKEGEAQS